MERPRFTAKRAYVGPAQTDNFDREQRAPAAFLPIADLQKCWVPASEKGMEISFSPAPHPRLPIVNAQGVLLLCRLTRGRDCPRLSGYWDTDYVEQIYADKRATVVCC